MPRVYQHTLPFSGDAFEVFCLFKNEPHVFFLDSSLHHTSKSVSYIGFAPFKTFKGELSDFKKAFNQHRLPRQKISFPAGAVGYFGYDGSLFFGFYDTVLAIDHQQKKLIISSLSQARVKDILKELKNSIMANPPAGKAGSETNKQPLCQPLNFKSNFTKAKYIKAIRQALEHIRRGDIYQINLSHQIKFPLARKLGPLAPVEIYQHLRQAFPSEFGAYFDDGKQVILSASPERFLKLYQGVVEVKPMKGTRPRGNTKLKDRMFKKQLKKSPKEIAELLMVTDLERNDLGRVCEYGSVKVNSMRDIETYLSVFQATSSIEGRLRHDCDQFDLLQATFPSGSVTGCPKIEAMKIIKKLEGHSRGLYTGALGYMSFSGDMDFNVMIRTMFVKRREITFHVGGGIVADSKPQEEWEETWVKAQPLIKALKSYENSIPRRKIF